MKLTKNNLQAIKCLKELSGKILIVTSEELRGIALLYAKLLNIKNNCIVEVKLAGFDDENVLSKYNKILLLDSSLKNEKCVDFSKNFSLLPEYIFTALSFYFGDDKKAQSIVENFNLNTLQILKINDVNVFISDEAFEPAFDYLKYTLTANGDFRLVNINKFDFLNGKVALPKEANVIFFDGKDKKLDKLSFDAVKQFEIHKIQTKNQDAFVDSCMLFLWAFNICNKTKGASYGKFKRNGRKF